MNKHLNKIKVKLTKCIFFLSKQYSQPVRVTSYGEHEEQNVVLAPSFLNDTLLTDMDNRCDWTERNLGLYEEIPR